MLVFESDFPCQTYTELDNEFADALSHFHWSWFRVLALAVDHQGETVPEEL